MKKLFTFLGMAMLWLLPTKMQAEDYLMPQWGYEEKTVATGETLTFYDFKGESDIPSSSSSNSYSTVVFKPAEAGYGINIVFDYIEVEDDGSAWVSYLDVFDGVFDKTLVNGGTYPSSIDGNTTPFSKLATPLKHYENGNFANENFLSGDATGALSVCFHYRYAGASRGWKATVTTVKLQDMELKSATAIYDFVDTQVWKGKQNVALAGLDILAEGGGNPDALSQITFTLDGAAVVDAASLAVYAGKAASVASLTNVGATITENDGVYTATLNKTLGSGDNYFTIGANILSSAAFNAAAKVNITGIATVGGFTTFTAATPAEVKVAAMYLMATDATYSISEETLFYDDGGKDGNISQNFNGKVLFEPATAGQKVSLTFNTIHLFYSDYAAGSSGNVDWLYVYNGNSTESKDLLWQAVQADYTTPVVIKSTADNGALTVVHRSQAASSNLKAGWEATVNTFTPQPMVVKTAENTKQTDATISAGAENVQVASIKLTTEETEPALVVKELAFNTNNTYSQISKAKLYYTKDNTFATTTLLGEVQVTADKVTLAATNAVNFREGENYLWLAYDIQTLAENDKTVDVVLEKLSFTNNTDYTAFAAIEGNLTIKNVAIQACGSQTITIQGEWEYTHTVASEYSTKYKAEDCDQTVIFRPATTGNVIQIDYTDFDVYYSTSSWSTRAKYIVYAGEGTSGEKLWELDAHDKKPTQIRSNAANGAITIVFNPNTTSAYYTGEGWHATVKEYTPKNMVITDLVVEQATDKLVRRGEQKADMLNVNLKTEGTLNPLTLESVTLNLKGTEANISKVYLMKDGAEIASAESAATITLTLASALELAEYDNEFTIAVDISDEAQFEQTVDIAITAGKISGMSIPVENGDPEGARPIKNVYYLQAGDNGSINIGQNSLMFYDDGGSEGTYTKNIEGYVTFKPTTEGCAVELIVNSYKLSSGAPVKIYYGASHEGDADATVEYSYSDSEKYVGQSFISSAEDGSLTVYFKDQSYGSANDGWEFEIREHLLTNLTIESVTATSIASALQTVGAKDLKMLQVAVTVVGDRTPLTIDAITLSTNEFVAATALYQTGKVATFSAEEAFTAPYTISERGTYYFWVTADASQEANDNDVVTVSLLSIKSGEQTIAPTTAEIAQTKLAHGMRGVYFIGDDATDDFKTVAAAIEAMEVLGIGGNVVFNIAAGNYSEQVVLPEIMGTSAEATITFCSATGNAADVVFLSDNTDDTKGVWTVNGMDYLTLKNLSFKSGKDGYASVLVLKNKSQHVTVDGCYLTSNAPESSTTQTMQLVRLISEDEDNANCSYFTLKNSVLTNGYNGINLSQGAYATHPNQAGVSIIGNTFVGQKKSLILGTMQKDVTILNNSFTTTTSTTDCRAIDLRTKLEGHILIAGNTIVINAMGSGYAHGIYFDVNSQANCAEGTVVDIYNNAISLNSEGGSLSSGIRLRWLREVNITYNTVLINSPFSTAAPLWLSNNPTNLVLTAKNNILQNAGTGSVLNGEKGTYSHNALYSADGKISNLHDSFADWQTAVSATEEDGNLNEQAVFASNSLLILKEAGNLVSATPVEGITTDITGAERNATTPTIGAYEYNADLFRVPQMAEGYPTAQNVKDVQADIAIKADNLGKAYILVLPAETESPLVTDILAQGTQVTLQKDAEVIYTANSLTEETAYKAYIVLVSPLGTTADESTDVSFTTAWTLRPVVVNSILTQTVEAGAETSLIATLATEYEQAKPYKYEWFTVYDNTVIGTEATLNVTPSVATEYICRVSDKFAQIGYTTAQVLVEKEQEQATFEEYKFGEGQDNKYAAEGWVLGMEHQFYSGTYSFASLPNNGYFSGALISSNQDNDKAGYAAQEQSAAAGAAEGENFAVMYYSAAYEGWYEWEGEWYSYSVPEFNCPARATNSTEAQVISGMYLTNSQYAYSVMKDGDTYGTQPMKQGDWFSLTITAHKGETTQTKEVMLADLRNQDEAEHYMLDTWQWVDLREFGAVDYLTFTMNGTQTNDYGLATPTYYCIDNFGGKPQIDDLATQVVTSSTIQIDLSELVSVETTGKVEYSIYDVLTEGVTYELNGSVLTLNGKNQDKAEVVFYTTQRGQKQYLRLPVEFSISTDYNSIDTQVSIFPTLVEDMLTVSTNAKHTTVEVYAADGRLAQRVAGGSMVKVNMNGLVSGRYMIRTTTENGTDIKSVVKK